MPNSPFTSGAAIERLPRQGRDQHKHRRESAQAVRFIFRLSSKLPVASCSGQVRFTSSRDSIPPAALTAAHMMW